MAVPQQVYRSASERLHRVVANHFAMRTWSAGAVCVVLEGPIIESLLALKRLRESRVEWMREDMEPWFPHIHVICDDEKANDTIISVYLSRVDLSEYMNGVMTDDERVVYLKNAGIETVLIPRPEDGRYSEQTILAESILWATGLSHP